jgi:hypothetical protein
MPLTQRELLLYVVQVGGIHAGVTSSRQLFAFSNFNNHPWTTLAGHVMLLLSYLVLIGKRKGFPSCSSDVLLSRIASLSLSRVPFLFF